MCFIFYNCIGLIFKEAHSGASTKRPRLDEKNGGAKEAEKPAPETNTKKTTQDIVWPEPLTRTSTDVRTAVAPPPGVELSLPEGCQHLGEVSQSTTKEVQCFRLVKSDQKHTESHFWATL